MFWNDIEHHIGSEHLDGFWMSHPAVRAEINRKISGDPAVWPTEWFGSRFADRLPFGETLTIGCGTGSLERDLVGQGITRRAVAIDVAPEPLRYARSQADEAGLAGTIEYSEADARTFLREHRERFDAIFFHASLHHFDRLDELMELVEAALRSDGLLYLDEFVGPAMRQWNLFRLLLPNFAYYLLPPSTRRTRIIRTPRNPEDPTEAVAANEIVPAVLRKFRLLERLDYGGNLVSHIYPNLRRPGQGPNAPTGEQFDRAVARLLSFDRALAKLGVRSFHTVIVAQKPR